MKTSREINQFVDRIVIDSLLWAEKSREYIEHWLESEYPKENWRVRRSEREGGILEILMKREPRQFIEMMPCALPTSYAADCIAVSRTPQFQSKFTKPVNVGVNIEEREIIRIEPAKMSYFDFMFLQLCMELSGESYRPADYENDFGPRLVFIKGKEAYLKDLIARLIQMADAEGMTP